jgi:AraC family transcriptional regulator
MRKEIPMHDLALDPDPDGIAAILPSDGVRHRTLTWGALTVDNVEFGRQQRFNCVFKGTRHLLLAVEHGDQCEGEMVLEGLPKPQRSGLRQSLIFVPAGRQLRGWKVPRAPLRSTGFYIDPRALNLDSDVDLAEVDFKSQIFFDRDLWATLHKLKALTENSAPAQKAYAEALTIVLAHELVRVNKGLGPPAPVRGGLAGWQRRRVADYIEGRVTDKVTLAELARLVDLSPYHFGRAFKQSFGLPPLRYHASRRMEYAKTLLLNPALSITQIGMEVGFSDTSAFTTAFRKFAGATPTEHRRAA